jgi:WD40 repeat protein
MTADARFDRDFVAVLEDLYLGPSPDYRREVLAVATHRRQRPSWTFPGRWLPMTDITATATVAAPFRWRTIGVALLIVALLVATLAIVAGAQRHVPAPFGLTGNGQIVAFADGDLVSIDPQTGRSTTLLASPDGEVDPVYSLDGTRIAFGRLVDGDKQIIYVANADGSDVHPITAEPMRSDQLRFEWAPDSRFVLAEVPGGSTWLLDASEVAQPRVMATDATPYLHAFQPPAGRTILLRKDVNHDKQIITLDPATGAETVLADRGYTDDFGDARWSPDGTRVVYMSHDPADPRAERLWIVNADGTNPQMVTGEAGTWWNADQSWSPDGRWIAFNRWERTSKNPDVFEVRPSGLLDVTSGTLTGIGPLARDVRARYPGPNDGDATAGEGWRLDWSPDGKTLLLVPTEAIGHPVLVNPLDGTWRVLDALIEPELAHEVWQRKAP